MSAPAIEVSGLRKEYDETTAIDRLDLTVEEETVFGFLGSNGAGKTTTIEILSTLRQPTSGEVRIQGHDVSNRSEVVPLIGYLPEEPPVYDELTGREQLSYVAGLRDFGDESGFEDLAERFGLRQDLDKRVSAYSKGMKQKLSLIQAVMHRPDVLFLDEPTSGLDPRAARTVRDFIGEIADSETTVFLSTHILPVAEEIADEVGVLYEGTLVAKGSPEDLKRRVRDEETDTGGTTLEEVFLDLTRSRDTGTGSQNG